MRPVLEQLEPRDSLSAGVGNWDVVQVDVPQNLTVPEAKVFVQYTLNSSVILGQFGFAPAWSPNRIYCFNFGNTLFTQLTNYPPNTTTRILADVIGNGQIPVIYEPNDTAAFVPGQQWEEAAFNNGWPFVDPAKSMFPGDTYDLANFPQGQYFGVPLNEPNPYLVDVLIMKGLVWAPYLGPLDAAFSPWL